MKAIYQTVFALAGILGAFLLASLLPSDGNTITGLAVATGTGCCDATGQMTSEQECPGAFFLGRSCGEIEQVNVGCCMDTEGYCLSNYLQSNCLRAGGRFITSAECDSTPACLTSSSGTIRGSLGYPQRYAGGEKGVVIPEPLSQKRGFPIVFRAQAFFDVSRVEVRVEGEGYSSLIALYDDGAHGDGVRDDGVFGGVLNTHALDTPAITPLTYQGIFDGTEGAEGKVFIGPASCLPATPDWSEGRRGIVLLSDGSTPFFSGTSTKLIDALSARFPSLNLLAYPSTEAHDEDYLVLEDAQRSCPFTAQDLAVVIGDAEFCEQRGQVIFLSQAAFPDYSALDGADEAELFTQFCDFMLTEEVILQRYLEPYTPPEIETLSADVQEGVLSLQARITDTGEEEIRYRVYLDSERTVLAEGSVVPGEVIALSLEIIDGIHELLIEAEDSDGNLGFSDALLLDVDVASFIIELAPLPELLESPAGLDFRITHASDMSVPYTILLDGQPSLTGTATAGEGITEELELPPGQSVIQIRATDSQQREAFTFPYPVFREDSDAEE